MLRWMLIAGLLGYSGWVSYLYVQQGQKLAHTPTAVASQPQAQYDCPKLHCQCAKGETPSEVPDDDPPADGSGSMNVRPQCPEGLFPHCAAVLTSNPPSCKWACVPKCAIRGYVSLDCAP